MKENVDPVTAKDILRLLSEHPKGLDIIGITKELNTDVRVIRPILTHLQNNQKVGSGMKKFTGKLNYFMRYYFCLARDF